MEDGSEAMRLVRERLIQLFLVAARADIRRRLASCCWYFVYLMRTLFRIALVPLIVLELIVSGAVSIVRRLMTMADFILARVV